MTSSHAAGMTRPVDRPQSLLSERENTRAVEQIEEVPLRVVKKTDQRRENFDLRKLRRGQLTIQASIDLHGLTREQASSAVDEFLGRCLARGQRCASAARATFSKAVRCG